MIMLARAQGIPARMAIGFLPGQPSGTDSTSSRLGRPRVARALLPGLRLAALRADAGRPCQDRPGLQPHPLRAGPSGLHCAVGDGREPQPVRQRATRPRRRSGHTSTTARPAPCTWLTDNLLTSWPAGHRPRPCCCSLLAARGASSAPAQRGARRRRTGPRPTGPSLISRLGDLGIAPPTGAHRVRPARSSPTTVCCPVTPRRRWVIVATLEQARYAGPAPDQRRQRGRHERSWKAASPRASARPGTGLPLPRDGCVSGTTRGTRCSTGPARRGPGSAVADPCPTSCPSGTCSDATRTAGLARPCRFARCCPWDAMPRRERHGWPVGTGPDARMPCARGGHTAYVACCWDSVEPCGLTPHATGLAPLRASAARCQSR